MRWKEIILEGRDAPLYHGTNPVNAVRIVRDGEIGANTMHAHPDHPSVWDESGVSLSRLREKTKLFGSIVFVINQRRLSQTRRLYPIDYWSESPEVSAHGMQRREGQFGEAEEFVIGAVGEEFWMGIDVDAPTYEKLCRDNQKGMPFHVGYYDGLLNHPLFTVNGKPVS